MKWREGRRSGNVEDVRGRGMGGGAKFGIGTLVVMAAAYFLGVDPSLIMGIMEGGGTQEPAPTVSSGWTERERQLVAIGAIEAGMFHPKRVFAG